MYRNIRETLRTLCERSLCFLRILNVQLCIKLLTLPAYYLCIVVFVWLHSTVGIPLLMTHHHEIYSRTMFFILQQVRIVMYSFFICFTCYSDKEVYYYLLYLFSLSYEQGKIQSLLKQCFSATGPRIWSWSYKSENLLGRGLTKVENQCFL
jgi:hypothetical protein